MLLPLLGLVLAINIAGVAGFAASPSFIPQPPFKKMFTSIPIAPEDEIFKVSRMFNECKSPNKVSCGVGAYRDNQGSPLVLRAVVEAKKMLSAMDSQKWTHEYLPIAGHGPFLQVRNVHPPSEAAITVSPPAPPRISLPPSAGTSRCSPAPSSYPLVPRLFAALLQSHR